MYVATCGPLHAQEGQKSAELYLEEYTDAFQESFFEGLKQKGIGNYDRAIGSFLKCKELEPSLAVVDHELAKSHFLAKQYPQAQEYALAALAGAPADYWVLEQLVAILDAQGIPLETIEERLPRDAKVKENLALVHYQLGQYTAALQFLEGVDNPSLKAGLSRKITDSLREAGPSTTPPGIPHEARTGEGTAPALRARLEGMMESGDHAALLPLAREAVANYPLQPYFYYAQGVALIEAGDPAKAVEVLGSGLDFLVGDLPLRNNIYRELARAHTLLGNLQKANGYLNKINAGS